MQLAVCVPLSQLPALDQKKRKAPNMQPQVAGTLLWVSDNFVVVKDSTVAYDQCLSFR